MQVVLSKAGATGVTTPSAPRANLIKLGELTKPWCAGTEIHDTQHRY